MIETLKENRVFERFSARFPVRFKHSSNDYGTDVFLRDASAQGARFTSKERLFLDDSVSLEVKLPDAQEPLVLNGRIVWTSPKAAHLWDVGLEFHKVDFMRIQRMYKIIEKAI
jgi:Tfp pilus assembly protein PilZ